MPDRTLPRTYRSRAAHRAVVPLPATLLLLAMPPGVLEAQDAPPRESGDDGSVLEVSGSAEVFVPSDRARLSLAVETEAPSARQAALENAERMDRVIGAVRELELEGLEVETHGYALQPQYRRPSPDEPDVPRIVAYRVTNHLRITVHDVDAVGGLIDAGVEAGANRVASLHFDARDTEGAREEAIRAAVRKARGEAEIIADAMGVGLGPVQEVRGGADVPSPRPVPWRERMVVAEAADVPTPVEAGTQRVSASVRVIFRLEP